MPLQRRSFLRAAASLVPAAALHDLVAQAPPPAPAAPLHVVGAGEDRCGKPHSLGFSSLTFKVMPAETGGGLFVIEHTHLAPGGPPLHLHPHQDEWFYLLEGEVVFRVGEQTLHLGPGESILAPRAIPHTFSSLRASSHMLIGFTPAGKMEQYFRDAEVHRELAGNPDFIRRYDMEWIGPSPFWPAKTS